MRSNDNEPALILEARIDDLDLDDEGDRAIWEERLRALGEARLAQARSRLERMEIIDGEGRLISSTRPPDMLSTSETSVETG